MVYVFLAEDWCPKTKRPGSRGSASSDKHDPRAILKVCQLEGEGGARPPPEEEGHFFGVRFLSDPKVTKSNQKFPRISPEGASCGVHLGGWGLAPQDTVDETFIS